MVNCTKEFLITAKKLGILEMLENISAICFNSMKPVLIEYIPEEKLKIKFPVMEIYLNPLKAMQGGFISAAFDNAFGLLCTLSGGTKFVSLDLNTNYNRPIYENDELNIYVYLKYNGKTIVNMYAEAFNNAGDLIATSNTKIMLIKK